MFVAIVRLAVLCNLSLLCLIKGMVGQSFPLTGTADVTPIVSALTKAKWSEPHLSTVSDIQCLSLWDCLRRLACLFLQIGVSALTALCWSCYFFRMFCPHCDNHLSERLKPWFAGNVLNFLEVKVGTEYHTPRLKKKIMRLSSDFLKLRQYLKKD